MGVWAKMWSMGQATRRTHALAPARGQLVYRFFLLLYARPVSVLVVCSCSSQLVPSARLSVLLSAMRSVLSGLSRDSRLSPQPLCFCGSQLLYISPDAPRTQL